MFDDPRLDARVRTGLSDAAEAVEPAVDQLLAAAVRRGRRRRVMGHVRSGAAALIVAAALVGVVVTLNTPGTAAPPTIPLTRTALIGTWQTPLLPTATWEATYRRVGGGAAAARAFVGRPMGGPATTYRVLLKVTDTTWAVSVSPDGGTPIPGWQGGYAFDGSRVTSVEASFGCRATYQLERAGAGLRIQVLADTCGNDDLLAQRTIFETTTFQPAG